MCKYYNKYLYLKGGDNSDNFYDDVIENFKKLIINNQNLDQYIISLDNFNSSSIKQFIKDYYTIKIKILIVIDKINKQILNTSTINESITNKLSNFTILFNNFFIIPSNMHIHINNYDDYNNNQILVDNIIPILVDNIIYIINNHNTLIHECINNINTCKINNSADDIGTEYIRVNNIINTINRNIKTIKKTHTTIYKLLTIQISERLIYDLNDINTTLLNINTSLLNILSCIKLNYTSTKLLFINLLTFDLNNILDIANIQNILNILNIIYHELTLINNNKQKIDLNKKITGNITLLKKQIHINTETIIKLSDEIKMLKKNISDNIEKINKNNNDILLLHKKIDDESHKIINKTKLAINSNKNTIENEFKKYNKEMTIKIKTNRDLNNLNTANYNKLKQRNTEYIQQTETKKIFNIKLKGNTKELEKNLVKTITIIESILQLYF